MTTTMVVDFYEVKPRGWSVAVNIEADSEEECWLRALEKARALSSEDGFDLDISIVERRDGSAVRRMAIYYSEYDCVMEYGGKSEDKYEYDSYGAVEAVTRPSGQAHA